MDSSVPRKQIEWRQTVIDPKNENLVNTRLMDYLAQVKLTASIKSS